MVGRSFARRAPSLPLAALAVGLWLGSVTLAAPGCGGDSGSGVGAGGSPDLAGAGGETSGAAASGATSSGGEPSTSGGSDVVPSGGDPNGGSGGSARAGSSTGGSGGSTAGTGGGGNALCTQVDSDGFFATCDACGPDCDTIDTDAGSRKACGCGSGCPCGLSCGCYEIAPNISVCDICVR